MHRCEPNYRLSQFIAEPGNTISNLSFVLFGLFGALNEISDNSKRHFAILYGTITLIGLGSMLFHGKYTYRKRNMLIVLLLLFSFILANYVFYIPTYMCYIGTLSVWGQQLDELSMVWYLLMVFYVVNRDSFGINPVIKNIARITLPCYALIFSIGHMILKTTTAFQVHFGILLALTLGRMYHRFRAAPSSKEGRQVIGLFVLSGLSGFMFWLIDYHSCNWFLKNNVYPYGHQLWHLLMGYCAYYSVAMLRILESQEGAKSLSVRYILGLPFLHKVVPSYIPTDESTFIHDVESVKQLSTF